jgi:tetratricopeptide (TPR) repeat protein
LPAIDEPGAERAPDAPPAALSTLLRELIAAPPQPAEWHRLAPGRAIGRFELVRELGRGGFGVVFEARDRELGRSVAFKAVSPGASAAAGEQLLHEAEAIAQLSHPNLVTLFDAGRCEHGPFLVLELLRGRTLRERLDASPIPVPEVLRIAADVARGLAHAHAAGVIHRDLKPSNVFLCEGGPAKVLDFGMAHAFGRTRVSGGTPAYMAPEQWRDEREDARADVFALGVLLHQLLVGRLPYGAEGEALRAGAPPPSIEVPSAPGLGPLVRRMLEPDATRRPRDASEALAAIESIAARSGRRARPRPRAWLLAIGALAAATTGLAIAGARRAPPDAPDGAPAVAIPAAARVAPPRDRLPDASASHDAAPLTRDPEAHELFRRGLYYWQRSIGVDADNRTAVELLQKAVTRDASFALAEAWLATMEVEWRGDCAEARSHAARAATLEPDLPQLHVANAGIRETCDHDTHGAIRELDRAVRLAPRDANARALLGTMRTTVGEYDAGLEDLRAALTLEPGSFLTAVSLARELVMLRRFAEAEQVCARARALSPGDVHALVLCALVPFWRDGDLEQARRAVDQLPREWPTAGNGAWSLFQLLVLFPDEALRLDAEGRIPSPFSTLPFVPRSYLLGCARAARGDAAAARVAFEDALPQLEDRVRSARTDLLAGFFLARALAGVGRGRDALREASRAAALAEEPEHRAVALRLTAEVAAAADRPDEALAALRGLLARPDGQLTAAALRVDPRFTRLRRDQRFAALIRDGHAARGAR